MSLWRNKINRTILISSIALVLILSLIIVVAVNPAINRDPSEENPDIPGLNWLRIPWAWCVLLGVLMWFFFFNLVLLIGSIREKFNALPGWTELTICTIITLLPAIFLGQLANFSDDTVLYPYLEDYLGILKWTPFLIALIGVVFIIFWLIMSKTPREEVTTARN
jgi:hypothetical protein